MKDFSLCMTAPSLFYSLLKPYARAVLLMGRIVEGDKGNATVEKTAKRLNPSVVMCCVELFYRIWEYLQSCYVLKLNVLFALRHQMFA